MKKLLTFFTNPIVISLIGLVLLSLLIWFGGPHIKFGEGNAAPLAGAVARLICIIILLGLWGLNNLRVQSKNNKQNKALVDELEGDLAADKGASQDNYGSEQANEELQQINQRFTQALSTLKELKFSGKGRRQALYELPWYIIVGPPGSGKTTALVNSSLDFPLAEQFGQGALQGVGGTRHCDWWFTNNAVLIDTAGRYTTQDSHSVVDSCAWTGFLNLLKRHRRRRPINGAIVAISLHDLLTQTQEERSQHARIIRARLDELMERLEIRFPIYLLFTKSDLVSGFTEFFEDLGKEEREQVWGISLPNTTQDTDSPDFEFLTTELNQLSTRLYERVLWRMHQERDVKRRGAIHAFPQQMENIKTLIDSFVRQTFIKNRYRFQPYLRGAYFTSGTQDGTAIDRLMTSVANNFGFTREVASSSFQQGKSFFLGKLFRDVIFPESELVGTNLKYEMIMRWLVRASYVGMAALTVIIIAVWAGSITQHNVFMSEVAGHVAQYNTEKKRLSRWNKDIRVVLPTLNALANASIVYDREEHPWLTGMGLYDGRIDNAADQAYAVELKRLLLPRLIENLEIMLRQGHRGGDLYNTFRTYMMFDKLEHIDKNLVLDWFKHRWAQQFYGEASRRKDLESHLSALMALSLEPAKLDQRIVKETRSLLLRVPVSKRVYGRLRTNPEFLQQVNLVNQFGESVRGAFKWQETQSENGTGGDLSVPVLFTIDGYEKLDFSEQSPVIADIVNENWVLSDDNSGQVDFVEDDLEQISEQVKEHYLSDYAKTWSDLYSALSIAPFTDLRHGSDTLASFTDPVYSPLLAILQIGVRNTQLSSPALENLAEDYNDGGRGKAARLLADRAPSTPVDKQFREINRLLRETKDRPAPISAVLQRIQQLQDFLTEISLAPDPSKKAFDIAKLRYQSGAGNAISALRNYAKSTPEPVRRWLTTLSDETWKVILRSAHQHINTEWRNQVYSPYSRALAGRYPLKRSAKDELALYDFSEFFKPEGTVDTFYINFIQPFIDTRSGWSNRSIDNYNLGFSSTLIKQVKKARAIKSIFFRRSADVPSLTFQLKPASMDEKDARFTLEIGDERISYNHGPKFWKTLTWSGEDENKRIRVIFEDLDGQSHSKAYTGPWAWFRLQDASRLRKTSKSNVYLATFGIVESGVSAAQNSQRRGHSIVYEVKAKSVNNPFGNDLFGSFRCPEAI